MTLPVFPTPPNIATNYSGWTTWKTTRIAAFKANCPLERATTYYFDATLGNNANDGLSENAPKQTRAAAIALTASGRRFRFKRGEVWRETGNWATGDNITIDDYGTGAKPVFDRFTVQHLAANNDWGTPSGNRKQVAELTDVAWVKLSAFPLTRPLQRMADAATCASTNDSWAWVSNVLYINLAGDDPNDFDIDVCPTNDGENGVELTGDGSRVENIVGYGWGCSRTDAATQDQPITNRSSDDDANLAIGCDGYYSGSHSFAHNSPGGGAVGGRFMAIECTAGYTKYSVTGGETVFNSYTTDGEQETWWIDCDVVYGTLPSSDWTPATNRLRGGGFYAHSSGPAIGLIVICGGTSYSSNTYGPQSAFHTGNMPTVTDTDLTTYRVFYVNHTLAKPAAAIDPSGVITFTSQSVFYGNTFNCYLASGGFSAFDSLGAGLSRRDCWFIQNRFTLDMGSYGNNNFGFWNGDGSTVWELFWYHNFIELVNCQGTSGSRFGLDFDIRGATTATGIGVPNAGTSRDCKFVNNVLKQTSGTTAVYFLGVDNTSDVKNNRLYQIQDTAGVSRGYNLTTSPISAGAEPVWNTTNATLLEAGSTELLLSHDFNGKARLVATPDIGPVDFSSPIVNESTTSGVQRFTQSVIQQRVQQYVTS